MKPRAAEKVSATQGRFDVCVIGGGATGAGCGLDAQLRGLKTLLLDAGDFAAAASGASTKLVHGGVRYLEQAVKSLNLEEFRMVKNALRERLYMLANAPHLAHSAKFLVPVYTWARAAYYLIGMKVYDAVASESNLFPSGFLSPQETLKILPKLKAQGLRGAVCYSDGQFDDARYDLALIETFVAAGGTALNYARVVKFARDAGGKLCAAAVQDEIAGEPFLVTAKRFVNATGTGADKVRALANPMLPGRMRPSKGVHLLFPAEKFCGTAALLVPHTEDGRVIFAVPWQGRLLVGTTDDEVTPATKMAVTQQEADYLLRQLNPYLATPLKREQTLSGMVGLRPLVAAAHQQTSTSRLLRDHEVELDSASGMISILGGKWTTHRLMAEDTIDAVQRELGGALTPCRTRQYPLAGSAGYDESLSQDIAEQYSLPADVAQHLAGKFGSRARNILQALEENPGWARRIAAGLPAIEAEIVYCVRSEMAETIEDVLARRTGMQLLGWKDAIAAAPAVGELLAQEKDWTPTKTASAVAEYTGKIRGYLNELGLDEAAP